jgi:hypothetical protein
MRKTRFALVIVAGLVGCGPRAPEAVSVPSVKATATPPIGAPSVPAVVPKPASLTAWVHVENVLSWATMFAGSNDAGSEADAASREETTKSFMELAAVFDFSRPTDGALAVRGKSAYDFAAVLPIRDKDRFLEYLAKDSEVLENKSRYVLKKHKAKEPEPEDDGAPSSSSLSPPPAPPAPSKKKKKPVEDDPQDEVSCEIGGAPLVAICGNERGHVELAPWLRTGPRPERGDVALELDAAPLRKILKQELESSPSDDGLFDPSATPDPAGKSLDDMFTRWTKNALGFASELERVTFYATKKSDDLDFSLAASFVTVESAWVTPLFAKPSDSSNPQLLEKLTENASAAVYSQGGGPLADSMASIGSWTTLPPAEEAKSKALMDELHAISMKPLGAAYGVDLPEVTRALAAYRSTKDPNKAQKALEKAIDGYGVFAASTDVTTAQRLMKEAARLFEVKEKASRTGAPAPSKKSSTSTTFRTAGASLGLPKGAFFLDETKTVEEGTGKKKTNKRVTAPEMLVVGDGTFTYFVVGLPDDTTFAARAKEIIARKPTSGAAKSPYADRKGLLLGGQLTSLVGAFASHEVSLRIDETQSEEARKKLADDLDRDVAAPRLVIPFALTSERRGPGGRVAFEIRGSSKAFVSVGEHAFSGIGALALLPLMALLHSPTSP